MLKFNCMVLFLLFSMVEFNFAMEKNRKVEPEKKPTTLEERVAFLEREIDELKQDKEDILQSIASSQDSLEILDESIVKLRSNIVDNQSSNLNSLTNPADQRNINPILNKLKGILETVDKYSNFMIGVGLISYVTFIIYAYFDKKTKKKKSKKKNLSFDFD